jgi:hypothetical protein
MSKRMFSTGIVESDAFLDMPLTAQALYMHLNMNADNDGFVNPKRVVRMTGAASDDLQILIAKRFLILFDSGVVAIKHWWINNTKRGDRHTPTTYQNELEELGVKPNKSYTKLTTRLELETEDVILPATTWQPNGNPRLPQYNTKQFNTIQSNSIQFNAAKPQSLTKSQKASYRRAVEQDKALQARERQARNRVVKTSKASVSIGELFGKK